MGVVEADPRDDERGSLYVKGIGRMAQTIFGDRVAEAFGIGGHRRVRQALRRYLFAFVRERARQTSQPMLNHLGLLVGSAQSHIDEANREGIGIVDIVDAPNTYAVFLRGPDGVCVEYVEHKPQFALA